MAKGLSSLVRLGEWGVEQKRRALGELLSLLDSYETNLIKLEQELVDEQHAAAADPEGAGFQYGIYANVVIGRRQQIQADILDTENKIEEAREELNDAYRDLKKYEIARDVRDKREQKERDRKEQNMLDDLGIQLSQRRRSS